MWMWTKENNCKKIIFSCTLGTNLIQPISILLKFYYTFSVCVNYANIYMVASPALI